MAVLQFVLAAGWLAASAVALWRICGGHERPRRRFNRLTRP